MNIPKKSWGQSAPPWRVSVSPPAVSSLAWFHPFIIIVFLLLMTTLPRQAFSSAKTPVWHIAILWLVLLCWGLTRQRHLQTTKLNDSGLWGQILRSSPVATLFGSKPSACHPAWVSPHPHTFLQVRSKPGFHEISRHKIFNSHLLAASVRSQFGQLIWEWDWFKILVWRMRTLKVLYQSSFSFILCILLGVSGGREPPVELFLGKEAQW